MRNSLFAKPASSDSPEKLKSLEAADTFMSGRAAERGTGGTIKRKTISWARGIPSDIRPRSLVIKFPRIANILADAWLTPHIFEARLKELMLDGRGGRQGFPFDVLQELSDLSNYFDQIKKPKSKDIWSTVRGR